MLSHSCSSLADPILGQNIPWHNLLYAVVAITLAWCLSFCVRSNIVDKHGHPIPPGPLLRYAFLGRCPEKALHVWTQKYGPLFSLLGRPALRDHIGSPCCPRPPRSERKDLLKPQGVFPQESNRVTWSGYHCDSI
jgi:hypothetical protein